MGDHFTRTPSATPSLTSSRELSSLRCATGWTTIATGSSTRTYPDSASDAATRAPAQFLGIDHLVGDIQVGMWADLLILEEDPLEDIAHIRSLQTVIKGGQLVYVR